ncbi:hypothetical protein [Microcoleus sp. Pol12B4]|uniref:hypothetical protein n=1 Tax=Microcoleus sp. Pol12B4 TaxID=3055395 RepID=UPI002FD47FB9
MYARNALTHENAGWLNFFPSQGTALKSDSWHDIVSVRDSARIGPRPYLTLQVGLT